MGHFVFKNTSFSTFYKRNKLVKPFQRAKGRHRSNYRRSLQKYSRILNDEQFLLSHYPVQNGKILDTHTKRPKTKRPETKRPKTKRPETKRPTVTRDKTNQVHKECFK